MTTTRIVYKATPPTLSDGDIVIPLADSAGNIKISVASGTRASTATLSALASLATSQQLLAANTSRLGLLLVNTDANAVLIKYGTTASATSFTARIAGNNGQWSMDPPIYSGRIDAIWEADGTGSLYVTEL